MWRGSQWFTVVLARFHHIYERCAGCAECVAACAPGWRTSQALYGIWHGPWAAHGEWWYIYTGHNCSLSRCCCMPAALHIGAWHIPRRERFKQLVCSGADKLERGEGREKEGPSPPGAQVVTLTATATMVVVTWPAVGSRSRTDFVGGPPVPICAEIRALSEPLAPLPSGSSYRRCFLDMAAGRQPSSCSSTRLPYPPVAVAYSHQPWCIVRGAAYHLRAWRFRDLEPCPPCPSCHAPE
jgi:hypothetical protein